MEQVETREELEARTLRLYPQDWRRVDLLAKHARRKPGEWLRLQVERLLIELRAQP